MKIRVKLSLKAALAAGVDVKEPTVDIDVNPEELQEDVRGWLAAKAELCRDAPGCLSLTAWTPSVLVCARPTQEGLADAVMAFIDREKAAADAREAEERKRQKVQEDILGAWAAYDARVTVNPSLVELVDGALDEEFPKSGNKLMADLRGDYRYAIRLREAPGGCSPILDNLRMDGRLDNVVLKQPAIAARVTALKDAYVKALATRAENARKAVAAQKKAKAESVEALAAWAESTGDDNLRLAVERRPAGWVRFLTLAHGRRTVARVFGGVGDVGWADDDVPGFVEVSELAEPAVGKALRWCKFVKESLEDYGSVESWFGYPDGDDAHGLVLAVSAAPFGVQDGWTATIPFASLPDEPGA